ncbi:MAG: tetratricopeptide repeat protein [Crocinitomicaceae bacterium]
MPRLLTLFLIVICSAVSPQAYTQEKSIEDLKKIILSNKRDTNEVIARNNLFMLLFRTNQEEAKKYVDTAIILARKLDYKRGVATAYHRYSILHLINGEFDRMLEVTEKASAIFSKIDDQEGICICDKMIANVELDRGHYDKALELCLNVEKCFEKFGNIPHLNSTKYTISRIHRQLGNYEQSKQYVNESIELSKSIPGSPGLLSAYNLLGAILSGQEKYKEAVTIFLDALALAEATENHYQEAMIFHNLGAQYSSLNDMDSARFYYRKALKSQRELKLDDKRALLYINLGNLEFLSGNALEAMTYYDSSVVLGKQLNAMYTVSEAYNGLSNASALSNDYVAALKWFKKFHYLNDSLVGERVQNNINELQIKYEAGKKDLKIAELEKKRLESNIKEQEDRQLIIVIVSSSLILIVLLILFFIRRNALVRERANKLEQKVFRAQMNPHFIFNSLNSIQRMYVEGNEDSANDYMADFSRLLRSILENSGKNRIPLKEELELTSNYLELEKLRTRNLFEFEIELDEDIDPLLTKVPPLIFQPYIENAIWHGIMPKNQRGQIQLNIQRNNGHLMCEISDDGVGFNPANTQSNQEGKTSQGMAITAERLGGDQNVKLKSTKGGGTSVTLKMDCKL